MLEAVWLVRRVIGKSPAFVVAANACVGLRTQIMIDAVAIAARGAATVSTATTTDPVTAHAGAATHRRYSDRHRPRGRSPRVGAEFVVQSVAAGGARCSPRSSKHRTSKPSACLRPGPTAPSPVATQVMASGSLPNLHVHEHSRPARTAPASGEDSTESPLWLPAGTYILVDEFRVDTGSAVSCFRPRRPRRRCAGRRRGRGRGRRRR